MASSTGKAATKENLRSTRRLPRSLLVGPTSAHAKPLQPLSGREISLRAKYRGYQGF